jgi:hypothetical protein
MGPSEVGRKKEELRRANVQAKSRFVSSWRLTFEIYLLHIRVRTFAVFGNEAVDPRGDNGQRHRAELEHGIVERAMLNFATNVFSAFSRARTIASSPI